MRSPEELAIRTQEHEVDVCVIGGGMTGICAALAAARHGVSVALMHERPVLGGNASSEVRMHIAGADRHGTLPNLRETGILEELRLENVRWNPNQNYSVWDTILWDKVRFQPGLTLFLNCTCLDVTMDGTHVLTVSGWQMTTETYHRVKAKVFIDCSGDGILAPLTGAECRMGREGHQEFGETIGPEEPDTHTMGMTCLIQARPYDTPQVFEPPAWAYDFPRDEDLPYGAEGHSWNQLGYWWVELGGEDHGIYDTEDLRDELLRIAFGVWDHIKNHGNHEADNWALEWVEFLPGKRESRRYVGDHILTQRDIEAEGRFPDIVAYGGWFMDDHHPAGFRVVKLGQPSTIFHTAPSPYGIPYRCLYSRNVQNLMFAGRCGSFTHAALSSTRVIGTCCTMGQAAGTAAALGVRHGLGPREVGQQRMFELQQSLLRDDCYLPWVPQEFGPLTRDGRLVASSGDPEPLRDGVNRPVGGDGGASRRQVGEWMAYSGDPEGQRAGANRPVGPNDHCWVCKPGGWAAYLWDRPTRVATVSLVLDSALESFVTLDLWWPVPGHITTVPPAMPRDLHVDGLIRGTWTTLQELRGNYQRLVRIPVDRELEGIRFVLDSTWGAESTKVFAFYVD